MLNSVRYVYNVMIHLSCFSRLLYSITITFVINCIFDVRSGLEFICLL